MTYETILTERKGDVLVITLNRPDRLNAASIPLAEELGAAFYDLDGARAVLITGAGKGFCSGADLAARGEVSPIQQKGGSHRALQNYYNPLITQILRCPVPVITAVNGAAAGVGCSIALAGDFVLAAKSAYFLQAFVNIGLVPDGGATWMLPRLVGRARAAEMMMLGERVPALKARDWGLVHSVVSDEQLEHEALALATRLAAGPTLALGMIRRGLGEALEATLEETLAMEAEHQSAARRTADSMEGGMAFLQKRKPSFTGK
jgi:2-(1,2-epoxy-1,2-dihydrophenyl)acetyl-CoA isomerase